MEDLIVIAVLVVVIGLAAWYIYKEKKSGKKCVGCPYAGSCRSKANGESCGCGSEK